MTLGLVVKALIVLGVLLIVVFTLTALWAIEQVNQQIDQENESR